MANTMTTYLVITALGHDKPGLVDEFSQTIADCGCNIEESRMNSLGGEFAIIMLISGNWNTVAKLETHLAELERRLGMTIASKRTEPRTPERNLLPYAADVVSLDHPGIVHQLSHFFSNREINIEELVTSSYAAAHTGTPMFSVHLKVAIPAHLQISALREEFMEFCDTLNLDAILEPVKQ